ncbi:MAG TPA: hypothetical protein VFS20_22735 [Longimicrobium sp.]|nr:hypothetical protein [Longimicrobium sp.]
MLTGEQVSSDRCLAEARRYLVARFGPGRRRERALTFLAQLAVLPAGYRVRGVYGWAHPEDFSLLAGGHTWAELLGELERDGRVEVHVASLADTLQPARLYRITQAGMDDVAGALREKSPVVKLPGEPEEEAGVYASEGARWALEALRSAPGVWLDAERVKEPSEQWNRKGGQPARLVFTSDVDELVSAGLAEARPGEGGGKRERARKLYRATESGLVVPVLKWWGRDPESEVYSQVARPLLRAQLGCFFYGSGN